jgi:hypothetical protein
MPITFDCPCGQRLSACDESAGQAAKCPKCGSQLTVPAPQALPRDIPVRDQPSAPLPPKRASLPAAHPLPQQQSPAADLDLPAWITTRNGLSVAFCAIVIGTIAAAVFTLCTFAVITSPDGFRAASGGSLQARSLMGVLTCSMLSGCAASVAAVIGWALCASVPPSTNARPPIYAALFSVAVAVVLALLLPFSLPSPQTASRSPAAPMPDEVRFVCWLSALLALASQVFFAAFLERVGKARGHNGLTGWIMGVAACEAIMAICLTVFFFAGRVIASFTTASLLLGFMLLLSMATNICLLYSVHQVRTTIRY